MELSVDTNTDNEAQSAIAAPLIILKDDIDLSVVNIRDIAEKQGVILPIIKSIGNTSFSVIGKCRKAFGIKKIGHAGTLDPLATGLLVIAIGRKATRHIDSFMSDTKTYKGTMVFGLTSLTDDAEGPLEEISMKHDIVLEDIQSKLDEIKKRYIGPITQLPPRFSAKKVNGKRMYKMARKGEDFEVKPTHVTVNSIYFSNCRFISVDEIKNSTISKYENNFNGLSNELFPAVDFEVDCGKGTYIRSLVRDWGEDLGLGGFMLSLNRVRTGEFVSDKCYSDKDIDMIIDARHESDTQ